MSTAQKEVYGLWRCACGPALLAHQVADLHISIPFHVLGEGDLLLPSSGKLSSPCFPPRSPSAQASGTAPSVNSHLPCATLRGSGWGGVRHIILSP
jgi:hypothetical protein